jgi:hypothetical protein
MRKHFGTFANSAETLRNNAETLRKRCANNAQMLRKRCANAAQTLRKRCANLCEPAQALDHMRENGSLLLEKTRRQGR